MPGHLRICAMSEATCSKPSPPLPQLPIFSTFLRGGLHFGCRTTSSCDLTATRWGNCTTRGSDTPATRCTTASCSATPHHCRHGGRTPPTRPGAMSVAAKKFARHGASSGSSAKKLTQQGPHNGTSAKKLAQRGQKHRIWGVLSTQGEVFRAFALKQRRRANFFAPGTATTRKLNVQGHDNALTLST